MVHSPRSRWRFPSHRFNARLPGPRSTRSRTTNEQSRRSRAKATGTEQKARFSVGAEGIYRVTYEQILAAGLDLNRVSAKNLILRDASGLVPIRVIGNGQFGAGSAIEFIGQPISTLYTETNLYTLSVGASGPELEGSRIADNRSQPGNGTSTRSYLETVQTAANNGYSFASPNGDPWFDQRLLAFSSPVAATRTLEVTDLHNSGQASLSVEMYGSNDWPTADPDHHVRVRVNGNQVADELFNGLIERDLTISLAPEALANGELEVEVEVAGDLGTRWDIVVLESIALTYPRTLTAREGTLTFDGQASNLFEIDGLVSDDIVVYRQSSLGTEQLRTKISGDQGNYVARIAGHDGSARYYLADAEARLTPEISIVATPAPISTEPADYLVVTHPDFEQGIAPLVAHREANGLRVAVVTTEQIYEQYSAGILDAEAIQEYIRDATAARGLRYVLLVGGDTYDYFDRLGIGSVSFLPSLYMPSGDIIQFAPADALYGVPTQAGIPQIAVGRLPVRTDAELQTIIDKIFAYENKDYGRTALAAADRDSQVNDISFRQEGELLLESFKDNWSIQRAYIDDLGVAGAKQVVLDTLNSGVALAQYFGHSGPRLWSFERLLQTTDVRDLQNFGRPATVIQWGCWNTYYVEPTYDTMGHSLMLSGSAGAAAVIGAATLTETVSDVALGSHFMPLLAQPGTTIGDALVWAKQSLAQQHPQLNDVIIGWAILGDPAMVIDPE